MNKTSKKRGTLQRIKCFFGLHMFGEWGKYTPGAKIQRCKRHGCNGFISGLDEKYHE